MTLIGDYGRAILVKKHKTLYLARLNIRSEAVGGGAVPEDEVQVDFCISSAKRDGHYSYMTEKTLRNYGVEAAAGVPFTLDHGQGVINQIGRTIAGSYDEASKQVSATISMLRDTDATPEAMRVDEYIRRIERGYYTDCSVEFRDAQEMCRLCNKDIWDFTRDDPCPHIPGRSYNGQVCEYDVDNGHLRAVSLVTQGSNSDAKKIDMREWDESLRNIKQEGDLQAGVNDDPKSILERDGQKYRDGLIADAIAAGIRAEDGFDEAVWRERFKTHGADFIIEQTATWNKLGDARWGTGGRKTESGSPDGSDNRIALPAWLFG